MTSEYQVTGPPGTGKTTWIGRQAERAAAEHGAGGVMITSLTRAAAVEIAVKLAERGVELDRERVGTTHSICLRALGLGRGALPLDSPKGIKLWNEWIGERRPAWRLTGDGAGAVDDPLAERTSETAGDELLARLNGLRQRRSVENYQTWRDQEERWPAAVRAFKAEWEACIEAHGACDFTMMIELAGLELDRAPGDPPVILADEFQDSTPLEASVLRRWGRHAERFVLVADPDQCLFSFRGSTPRVFLDAPVPEDQRIVLSRSHRVPRAVHAEAQRVIRRIRDRFDAVYEPRPEEGRVERLDDASWRRPDDWVDPVLRCLERDAALPVEERPPCAAAMVLAPCGFMLRPLLERLRREGVPYHNPYRPNAGQWNPLGEREGATAPRQLLAYLDGDEHGWTVEQLRLWCASLRERAQGERPAVLARGAKRLLEAVTDPLLDQDQYDALWRDAADGVAALRRDVPWLLERLTESERRRLDYAAGVAERRGAEALRRAPRLVVGTVHSTKGGEAQHVFALTALPGRWAEEPDAPDLCRLFYVAATRARESLTWLCGDRGGFTP